jgi:uncharacterized protein YjbJ (UPF0337 family)
MSNNTGTAPHSSGTENQLAGTWNRMTGRAQMLTGAQWDDPELFFTGVINALHGRLQESIGSDQAQKVSDALRLQWSGLNNETKGKILKQWGDWTGDPDTIAQGVVDLAQGKLDGYAGSSLRESGTPLSDAAIALSNQTAADARQALADFFGQNPA